MIGLTENGSVYEKRGYTPAGQARGYRTFRERGMPFATDPRERVHGTWPMCRVVVATRRLAPEREYAVFRALQFAQFTSTAFLEDPKAAAATRSRGCPASTPTRSSRPPNDPETEALFEQDRDEARSAADSPTEFQDKHANTDGRVRYTAPSIRFTNEQGVTLEAGGFQSFEAYDVLVANLDQSLSRRAPADDAAEVLQAFPDGLTTAEVALIMTQDKYTPDLNKAEDSLIAAIEPAPPAPAVRARRAVGPERARRARAGGLETRGRGAARGGAPDNPHGVVVDSVKVSVFLYVPVRSASVDLTGCLKLTSTRRWRPGRRRSSASSAGGAADARRCPTSRPRACSGSGSENVPLTRGRGPSCSASATVRVASPAVETTSPWSRRSSPCRGRA